jgi:hypothetical protein
MSVPYLGKTQEDEFLKRLFIKYGKTHYGNYFIWSAGPDLDHDEIEIKYDPTNGLISDGDILLTRN